MFLGTYQLMLDRYRPDLPRNFREAFLADYAEARISAQTNRQTDCTAISGERAKADSERQHASLLA